VYNSGAGILTGNFQRVYNAYEYGPLGQTAGASGFYYYGTRIFIGVSGSAAVAAGGLGAAAELGLSNAGLTQIGWRGGELTLRFVGRPSPDWRFNPSFRNDFGLPHYHRRPGIGKHRPWEGGW